MNTSSRTTWPRPLNHSLVWSLVCLVVSPSSVSVWLTAISHCWAQTTWLPITLRIMLTGWTWRICCTWERIIIWQCSYWNTSPCTRCSSSRMYTCTQLSPMTGRFCFCNDVIGSTLRFLLFPDVIHIDSAPHCGLCECTSLISTVGIAHAPYATHHLLECFGHWPEKIHSYYFAHHDWCRVWFSSARVHPSTQLGCGWVDGVLHSCHSHLLVLASNLFLLAYGWLLVCDSCCHSAWVQQEDYRTCISGLCIVVGLILTCCLNRMNTSSICVWFLSRPGMTTRASSGTKNPTAWSVCGSLLAINTRRATLSHGLPCCKDTSHSMSPTATPLPHCNNLACYPHEISIWLCHTHVATPSIEWCGHDVQLTIDGNGFMADDQLLWHAHGKLPHGLWSRCTEQCGSQVECQDSADGGFEYGDEVED